MIDFKFNSGLIRQVHRSPKVAEILLRAAAKVAQRVADATPVDTGETRASTRVEPARAPDGSAAARVVQAGAAVELQFGNSRVRQPARQFDRGL